MYTRSFFFLDDGEVIQNPMNDKDSVWKDDLKIWPKTEAPQITAYLLENKACDFRQMEAFRSLQSYNYLQSGWVGQVLVNEVNDDVCFLKGKVTPSQSLNNDCHTAWVCSELKGKVVTAGCSCMAGKGRACSHVGAVLWKVDLANRLGLTSVSCTDQSALWNRGTKQNITPDLIQNISFKKPKMGNGIIGVDTKFGQSSRCHNIKQFYSHKEMMDHIEGSGLNDLLEVPGTLFNLLAKPVSPCKVLELDTVQEKLIHDHSSPETLPNSCKPCNNFF